MSAQPSKKRSSSKNKPAKSGPANSSKGHKKTNITAGKKSGQDKPKPAKKGFKPAKGTLSQKPTEGPVPFVKLPPLTIQGKRELIQEALEVQGSKKFEAWLNRRGIKSVREVNEQVRKYKSRFFKELVLFIEGYA